MRYRVIRPVDPERELQRLEQLLPEPEVDAIGMTKRNAAPARPFDGMVVYADGTNWNPGSGQGVYYYDGSAWNLLG